MVGQTQPNIFNNNIIITYIIILYKKNSKGHLKIFLIFLCIFLPILHNIELYFYTIRFRFSIKIPGFLRNISFKKLKIKKNLKTLKLISPFKKKIFCFHAYGQILKSFSSIFSLKKCIFLMFKRKAKKEYRNQFMIIH